MINSISHAFPIGAALLAMATALAVDPAPNGAAYYAAHLVIATLSFLCLNRMARCGNVLMVSHVAVVLLFSIFASYVLSRVDHVTAYTFDFRVFSAESVTRALLLNDLALGITLLIYGSHAKLSMPVQLFSSSTLTGVFRGTMPLQRFYPALFALSWAIILATLFFTPSVLQFPYPENTHQPGSLHPTIRVLLVLIPFGSFLIVSAHDEHRSTRAALSMRITAYMAIILIGLMGGPRGGMVGLLLGLITVNINYMRGGAYSKWAYILFDTLFVAFAVFNWPHMRVYISDVGVIEAFLGSFGEDVLIFATRSGTDTVYLTDFPMLGQSLFHFLYVIDLVDSETSLHYQTFVNLIPQLLPEALDGVLWTRPINDNILLAEHFIHGGGFYSYANAYWNGGALPLALFSGALALVIARIEAFFKTQPVYYGAAYFTLLLLLPVSLYYGIQGLVRGIEYGLLVWLSIRLGTQIIAARDKRVAAATRSV